MARRKVPGSLTIVIMVLFTLLVIIYHILSDDVEDISAGRVKVEGVYPPNDLNESPFGFATQQQHDADILTNSKSRLAYLKHEQSYEEVVPLFKGHKIVHLDLKGAPPTVKYYRYLFPLLHRLGATGILIEYEDMFPFNGEVENIRALNSYSRRDIVEIQKLAKNSDLEIIPLIQTFGHFEFVLKLEKYKDLREVARYPQVLCPSHNKTLPLLYEMLDQVIGAHPNIKHFHIGADEVYQLAECSRCFEVLERNKWDKQQLFLSHVVRVATYIKKKYPTVKVLMWDDEFRDISVQEITDSGLNKLIEPVVWKYTTDPKVSLTENMWENYVELWPESVWIATAFKGATAPDRYYTDISYHLRNHEGWLEIIRKYSSRIKFKGVFLTGWQRYDHFSVLCDLLPSAIPSLAVNLAVLKSSTLYDFPHDIPDNILKILNCETPVTLSIPEPQFGWTYCGFHGSMIYSIILRLHTLNQEIARMEQDSTFKGWVKEYNLNYAFSNPSHIEHALSSLGEYKNEIIYIETDMRKAMEDIYDNYTIDEWIETYVEPLNEKLTKLLALKNRILERDSWPRRPLTKHEL
ncbi:hexosaminidase D [Neodiprion pinetum]|uniref:hexosaminidase D-like n=1 Tax=Neodiprion fabricii TaxID=2872261 RepID=UPI001ED90AFB|nr:hexosaminidase D-like [Neodiprion fabricii]XP_046493107.1 hexosaminidase D-like [Neodiprion pinetum]XP_046609607.1 hexosaminidase D-like [Neodiprion virginianus]